MTAHPAPLRHLSLSTAAALALAVALLHAALAWVAGMREGSFAQGLPPDQCADLRSAVLMSQALRGGAWDEFFQLWVHHSPYHTPFVPAVSSLVMAVFGETRAAGEAVLPVFTFLFVLGILRVVDRFYGRATAVATALLTTSFPVFSMFSRTYLFEHPLAAMLTLAVWALVNSDGFSRTGWTLTFGVLAGLASVTRGGAPVYLVGPVVAALAGRGRDLRATDFARLTAATAMAMALAATWYVPNWTDFFTYIHNVTYGSHAAVMGFGGRAFSWENAVHYAIFNVIDGPGLPTLAIAVACALYTHVRTRRPIAGRSFLAAAALAWVIDFLLLLVGAQQEGARYFQPLMPVVALAVVRTVVNVGPGAVRAVAGTAVGALALHQVLWLAFFFPPGPAIRPFETLGTGVPLYSRSTYHTRILTGVYIGEDPNADVKIDRVVATLESLDIPPDATIALFQVKHPFYHPNAIAFEMAKRRRRWVLAAGSEPHLTPREVVTREAAIFIRMANVVVLRTGGPDEAGIREYGSWILEAFPPSASPPRDAAPPLTLGDGSRVRFLAPR